MSLWQGHEDYAPDALDYLPLEYDLTFFANADPRQVSEGGVFLHKSSSPSVASALGESYGHHDAP